MTKFGKSSFRIVYLSIFDLRRGHMQKSSTCHLHMIKTGEPSKQCLVNGAPGNWLNMELFPSSSNTTTTFLMRNSCQWRIE